ncbi:MAG: NRDE family protein [Nannocystaceae bacterium]
MCTLLFAFEAHPAHRLVVAANRDELYARPTRALHAWEDRPGVIAGRDLAAGGTWMGLGAGGRWAALTNVRQGPREDPSQRSRGELVADFLEGGSSARAYLEAIEARAQAYNGFNLVVGDADGLLFLSNRDGAGIRAVAPGIHGLSNATLDTPWPKVQRGKASLAAQLRGRAPVELAALLGLLGDRRGYADAQLPDTGVGLARERELAPLFIATPGYGTRSSTALTIDRDGRARVVEETVDPGAGGRVELVVDSGAGALVARG